MGDQGKIESRSRQTMDEFWGEVTLHAEMQVGMQRKANGKQR
jgi:hypothetical protein